MKPKTKQMTIDKNDLHKGAFASERIAEANKDIEYKTTPYYGYRYGTKQDRVIRLGDNDTIEGRFTHTVTIDCLNGYLSWVKENCVWHRTRISYAAPKESTLTDLDTTLQPAQFTNAWVDSRVLRKMTDNQKEDLKKVKDAKAKRVAKQKQETKERNAKERAEREKQKKRESIHEEYGDLASALHVLKKHGLKVVTVDEPRTRSKK